MALQGSTNEQKIWNFLMAQLNNASAVAGIMGNLYAESGLSPTNLQNTHENAPSKTFGIALTDATYYVAVDKGTYSAYNFAHDKAGFGICQWTYWSRKENLLKYAKSKGKSVGDLEIQLEFMMTELTSYKLIAKLKAAVSVREASNIILLEFEAPASKDSQTTQDKRAGYGQGYYDKYASSSQSASSKPQQGGTTMSNSPLVTYTKITSNRNSPRNHAIDRITIHCIVGQWTAKQGCDYFASTTRQCSANYVVGKDGSIGLSVEEKDRSWCTSSSANDHRAITIETASDATHPYAVTTTAYEALIKLCADICKRNGKKRVTWLADKDKSINYTPASDEMIFTVHRWFAAKACPGDYLYNRQYDIMNRVNALLGSSGASSTPAKPTTSTPSTSTTTTSTNIKVGDTVSITNGATYYSGAKIPAWVIAKKWIVSSVNGDRIIINKSADDASAINSPVNAKYLKVVSSAPVAAPAPETSTSTKVTRISASKAAQSKNVNLAGEYVVTASDGLHLRDGAGTGFQSLVVIPKGTHVMNYGYYTKVNNVNWLYIQFTMNGITYTGFSSSQYLKKG